VKYANLDKSKVKSPASPAGRQKSKVQFKSKNILDKWILSKFAELTLSVEKSLKEYNAKDAALEIEKFVNELSTWYIRRSRDRVWLNSEDKKDKEDFYQTLNYVLVNLSLIISPFMPYISEEIYTNLTGQDSVHLANWPVISKSVISESVSQQMDLVRKVAEAGHAKRKEMKIKVRLPLAKLEVNLDGNYSQVSDEIWDLVLKELNIKNIVVKINHPKGDRPLVEIRYPKKEVKVSQEQLKKEGELRELLRQIQGQRKKLGLKPTDRITLTVPRQFLEHKSYLLKKVMAKKIIAGDEVCLDI